MGRIPAERLRRLRNEIDIKELVSLDLEIPGNISEGYFRFQVLWPSRPQGRRWREVFARTVNR